MSWGSSFGLQHDTPGPGESVNKFSYQGLYRLTFHHGVIRKALLALGDTNRVTKRIKACYEDRRTNIIEYLS